MALSDDLTDLAGRTKHLEDTAAAVESQNKVKLEKEREKLHGEMQTEAKKIESSATDADTKTKAWWAEMTARAEKQRKDLHSKIDERKAERKVDKAMRHADDAENYAVNMIQVARYCIDAAEYAVTDAAIARTEADDLVAAR
jgi:hypothetical protein